MYAISVDAFLFTFSVHKLRREFMENGGQAILEEKAKNRKKRLLKAQIKRWAVETRKALRAAKKKKKEAEKALKAMKAMKTMKK